MAENNSTKMGVVQLTIITAVNMLGSGIIMLPSKLAQVGTMSVLSWIVTLGGALCLAWVFARNGMFSKKSGGMGGYAEYSYGKAGSFMSNFTYGLSLVIANVAIAVSAVGYLSVFLDMKLSPVEVAIWTIILVIVTTLLNFGGAKITGRIGSVTVWGVILPVVILAVLGWFWFQPSLYVASWNPHDISFFDGIASSIPITLWAFLGLESAVANMDAVENPQKNVPIAVMAGTIGAGIIYILSTNVMAGIVKNSALLTSNAPFGLTFSTMFGSWAGLVVEGIMVLACIGSLLGWQFTIAQVFKSSADEGYFPKVFSRVTKNDTPIVGMLILMTVQVLLSFMTISPDLNKQFNVLVNLAVVTNLVPYLLSMGAAKTIQLGAGVKPTNSVFRLTNVIAVIAAIYSLYAMYASGSQAMVLGSLVTFFGWTAYSFVAYKFDLSSDKLEKLNNNHAFDAEEDSVKE
ncbi:putrescine-ornithine antiporter [Levilactobacillus zymae]|uniref:putrescine-ornithine antiporter n=1 Tax=Levilactobacillus zymae TaxID=267363 RepID=UPI0028B84BFE|nr:putrescine-ornithine antiporter [Levilactobacillus zymae]MDT6979288.1 putrescine-ornithine antiporter [Levilactobacillus zymae]